MALNAKKRQQKRARKAAKRKTAITGKKKTRVLGSSRQILSAANGPIHQCLMPENLFELGMGNVVVSRTLPGGQIGAAFFLLDVFCLGVKDAHFDVMPREVYNHRMAVSQHGSLREIDPSCARKLVESAEAYARDLGFKPHADYQMARKIFADIDAAVCPTQFEFGKDSMPFFMSGPYDTPAKCERIVKTLTQRCGPDGFHYMMAIDNPFDDFDDFDDDDDD
jgi:hypothetical protein